MGVVINSSFFLLSSQLIGLTIVVAFVNFLFLFCFFFFLCLPAEKIVYFSFALPFPLSSASPSASVCVRQKSTRFGFGFGSGMQMGRQPPQFAWIAWCALWWLLLLFALPGLACRSSDKDKLPFSWQKKESCQRFSAISPFN